MSSALLLQSLLFSNFVQNFIVLTAFMKTWRHVLDQSGPAPILKVLQSALSLEIDAPGVKFARSRQSKGVFSAARNLPEIVILLADLHDLVCIDFALSRQNHATGCLWIVTLFVVYELF